MKTEGEIKVEIKMMREHCQRFYSERALGCLQSLEWVLE